MGRHLSKYLSECACAECLGGGNNPHKRSGTEFRRVYLRKHRNETYCNLRNIHGRNALGAQAVIDLLRARRNADASLLSFESKYFRRLRSRRVALSLAAPSPQLHNLFPSPTKLMVRRIARDALRIPEKSMRRKALEPVWLIFSKDPLESRECSRCVRAKGLSEPKANRITLVQRLRQQASSVAASVGR